MHRRSVRFALLTLLVTAAVVAALFLQDIERRAGGLLDARSDVDARLHGLSETLAAVGSAQQSYVTPGQADEPWFQRTSELVRQLYEDTRALRPLLRSGRAQEGLRALSDGADALMGADTRVRENLQLGLELMAADVILSDGRTTLEAMSGRVRDLRTAEHAASDDALAALAKERWIALGVTALVWLTGVFALVPATGAATTAGPSLGLSELTPDTSHASSDAQPPAIDLAEAATLCTALSRVTSTAALPGLLSRAAGVLNASGTILWMSAGEELFAVTAHGYRPQLVARLGPIARSADNATAAAWRSGELMIVAAAEGGQGAIVAPMFGPDRCIGVLASEVRDGRERDPSVQAVAMMIAAQLASSVSAWPAASAAPASAGAHVDASADPARHVARQLA